MAKNLCHGLHTRQIRGEFREESAPETEVRRGYLQNWQHQNTVPLMKV